jgi:outer membrane biosynthesis protein TonB
MNDIQDIILESEYNVLNSLYEYYNKQFIMESYYMEDGEQQSDANPQKENLIKRFIEWCKRFFASIKAKFKKVPPKTPVPEAYAAEANQLNQMTQTYTQINSQNSNTQQQIEQNEQLERQSKIVQIKEKKQQKQQKPQQQTQQQSNQMTMETIEQNIQQVQTVINNVEQEIVQMDSIASQAQDAVNPEKQKKRRAAEAKVKAGSSLLQKLGELFGAIANTIVPVGSMEGEPLPDPKGYGQQVIDSIKKATTIKDVQTIYNNAEKFYTSAYKWYSDRAESPSQNDASLREGNYYKNKCKIIQQWREGIKQVQEQRINELNNGVTTPQSNNQSMPDINSTAPQPKPTPQPAPAPAPTQTAQPSQQAPTPTPQPTPTPAPQPTPQPQQAPQPTPNAQDNVNPQPAPVQQTPPPTNNAMNGGQLFQLVQQLRNNGNNFRVFNAATNKVEYSTDGNSAYIINGNLLYPNKTSRSKTLDINPAVFDVNTKLIDDTSSITPATVDQGGFITQKGSIG